ERACRVGSDRCGPPRELRQIMVDQVLEAGLESAIIFAGDKDEAVGRRDAIGQRVHRRGGLSCTIVAVAPVEHRQIDRLRVDQLGVIAACGDGLDDPARELDALSVAAVASVEDENRAAHILLGAMRHAKTEALAHTAPYPKLAAPKRGEISCASTARRTRALRRCRTGLMRRTTWKLEADCASIMWAKGRTLRSRSCCCTANPHGAISTAA